MSKAEGIAVLASLAHEIIRCGCFRRGRYCPHGPCVEEIARALCLSSFTHDALRVLYAARTEEEQ